MNAPDPGNPTSPRTTAGSAPRGPRPDVSLWVLGIAFALYVGVLGADRPGSWSDASRLATIESLVERGTFSIDGSTYQWTGDRVRIGGRFASHQPPLLAVLAAPAYATLRAVGFSMREDPALVYRTLTGLFSALPLLAVAVALRRRLRPGGRPAAFWVPVALLLGSLATPYALVLNHHLPAAACAFFALSGSDGAECGRTSRRLAARAGLWLGAALALDPGAGCLALAFVLLPRTRGGSAVPATIAGLLPGVLVAAGLNLAVGGTPWPIGLQREAFDYPGSVFLVEPLTGFLPDRTPGETLYYAWRTTFGTFGVFFYHPWLLLGVLGAARAMRESGNAATGARILLGTGLSIAVFSLLSDNFSGSCFGIRWYVAFVPWLAWAAPRATQNWPRRVEGGALAGLTIWSASFAGIGALIPWAKYDPLDRPAEARREDAALERSLPERIAAEVARVRGLLPRFTREELEAAYHDALGDAVDRLAAETKPAATVADADRLLELLGHDPDLRVRALRARAHAWERIGDASAALADWGAILRVDSEDVRARIERIRLLLRVVRVPVRARSEVLSLQDVPASRIESHEPDLALLRRELSTALGGVR